MEISNYYVPGALLLPLIAIVGIFAVTLAMRRVLRRRRQDRAGREEAERS